MSQELLREALDMINTAISSGDWKVDGACDPDSLIRRLKAKLALDKKADNARELGLDYEPEQEPVAWMEDSIELYVSDHPTHTHTIPLYTAPPRKEWVGLTQDEIEEIYRRNTRDNGMCSGLRIALEVQLKLKEKNT